MKKPHLTPFLACASVIVDPQNEHESLGRGFSKEHFKLRSCHGRGLAFPADQDFQAARENVITI